MGKRVFITSVGKRVFITSVKGNILRNVRVWGGIKEALKHLPECHTTQQVMGSERRSAASNERMRAIISTLAVKKIYIIIIIINVSNERMHAIISTLAVCVCVCVCMC